MVAAVKGRNYRTINKQEQEDARADFAKHQAAFSQPRNDSIFKLPNVTHQTPSTLIKTFQETYSHDINGVADWQGKPIQSVTPPSSSSSSNNSGNYWSPGSQQSWNNNPWPQQGWQQGSNPFTNGNPTVTTPYTPTQVKEAVPEKPKYKPEELHGKFCGYVRLTRGDTTYTGILFVKRCGVWKLLEFNGSLLIKSDNFVEELKSGTMKIQVIQTLYDDDRIEPTEMDLEIT